jgi:hypothetical protein
MKRTFFLPFLIIIIFFSVYPILHAQKNEWVNQVIIANGGKFEGPPFTDYVTVQSYNPVTKIVNVFDTIYTQSTQDVVIDGNVAYVAAQDSIVMYNIDTHQRIAASADSGISKLYFYQNKLIITKNYPIKRFFVEILDATNLALLGLVQGISGECGGAVMSQDLLYVAVDSGYLGTRGKLAIIDPASNWSLIREVDFGTEAIGMWNLYNYNNQILAVNKTPYGGLDIGSLSLYNVSNSTFQNYVFTVRIGDGYGIIGNLLYLKVNDGVGSINLATHQIADTSIIPAPSSSGIIEIHSAAVDYINNQFYLNIGNYSTFGIGVIATLTGDSLDSYATGVNAEGIAIDYRTPSAISNNQTQQNAISISPNPVTDFLTFSLPANDMNEVKIFDLTGKQVYSRVLNEKTGNLKIDCTEFPSGIYLLSVIKNSAVISKKFIRK